jgi:hypothetical protein
VTGYPTELVYTGGDYELTWVGLETGALHMFPEIWMSEDGPCQRSSAALADCLRAGGTRVSSPLLAGVECSRNDCAFADGKYYTTFVIDRGTVLSAGSRGLCFALPFSGDKDTAAPAAEFLFWIDRDALWNHRVDSLRAGKLGVVGRNGWYTEDRMLNTWYILVSRWGLA